jgi:transposase
LLAFVLTGGQVHDITEAANLLNTVPTAVYVIADKAFDSDALVAKIRSMGAIPVIPSKCNRKTPRRHDEEAYKRRNLIERFFCRIKEFRRLATRYDKLTSRFGAFLLIATATLWVK